MLARAKRRRVGVGDTDRIAKRAASDRRLRRLQHFFRYVDAEKFGVRVKARRAEKIAGGSASDLQHRSTGRRLESGEHLVASEQIGAACQVVNKSLAAVDRIHRGGAIRHGMPQLALT